MSTALILALAAARPRPRPTPTSSRWPLHRSMEIDDLDREIQRLHDTVLVKRAQLAATQRLAQRGLVSRATSSARSPRSTTRRRARSSRAPTASSRSTSATSWATPFPPTSSKAYGLLLDWIKKQEAIGQVDVDYRGFLLKQTRALYQRKAVGRQELEDAELAYNMALASVALSQSRQAQVLMELAARQGREAVRPRRVTNGSRPSYLKARVRYFEIVAEAAQRRLDDRPGTLPARADPHPASSPLFQKAADDADATLAAERKKLENPGAS